jgi:hypothetical protein
MRHCEIDAAGVPALLSPALGAAGELRDIAVRPTDVEPLPTRVLLDLSDHLDPCSDELRVGRLEVVDFEQRHGTTATRAEQLVIAVTRPKTWTRSSFASESSAVASSPNATANPRTSRRSPTPTISW